MSCLTQFKRFLAGVIVVTFLTTNTLMPTPTPMAHAMAADVKQTAGVESPAFLSSLQIPAELGKVTDVTFGTPQAPVLVHIQEAHANYDAQKNIQKILGCLSRDYGVKLILLEGAGNKLQPELFNFFPKNKGLQQTVNDRLLAAGELTGAEAFLINENGVRRTQNTTRAEAYGIENAAAYAKDREAYRKVYENRVSLDQFLSGYYLRWQEQANLHMGKDLREFLSRFIAFEEDRLPLQEWLASLQGQAAKTLLLDLSDVRSQVEWPVLVRYVRLKSLEGKIDGSKLGREKAGFFREIARHTMLKSEIEAIFESVARHDLPVYKTRFVFERLMDVLPKDFSFEKYPNLRLSIQQMILMSELQGDRLQSEIRELTKRIVEKLAVKPEEKQLAGTLREYRLFAKLFHLELSRDEYQQIIKRKVTPESLAPHTSRSVTELFGSAMQFYELAVVREDLMMKRAREIMAERKADKAVIITGGFHTEGFKDKILASGSSYVGITPAIGEIAKDSQKNYLAALLGSNAITRSHIAPEVITQPSFFSAVSPRLWRRELAVRFARIRNIVLSAIADMKERSAEHQKEFDSGFQRLIAASVGVAVPAHPAIARSESRELGFSKELEEKDNGQSLTHRNMLQGLREELSRWIRTAGPIPVDTHLFSKVREQARQALNGVFSEDDADEAILHFKNEILPTIYREASVSQQKQIVTLLLHQAGQFSGRVNGFGTVVFDQKNDTRESLGKKEDAFEDVLFSSKQAMDALGILKAHDAIPTLVAISRTGLAAHHEAKGLQKLLDDVERLEKEHAENEAWQLNVKAASLYEAIRRWTDEQCMLVKVIAALGHSLPVGDARYQEANRLLVDILAENQATAEGRYWLWQQAAYRLRDFDSEETVTALTRWKDSSLKPSPTTVFMSPNLDAANNTALSIQLQAGMSLIHIFRMRTFNALKRMPDNFFTASTFFEAKEHRFARLLGIQDALISPEVDEATRLKVLERLATAQDDQFVLAANILLDVLEEMVLGRDYEIFNTDAQRKLLTSRIQKAALNTFQRIASTVSARLATNASLHMEYQKDLEGLSAETFPAVLHKTHIALANLHKLESLQSFHEGEANLDLSRKIVIESGGGASVAMAGVVHRMTTDPALAVISGTDNGGGTLLVRGRNSLKFHVQSGAMGDTTRFATSAAVMESVPAALVVEALMGHRTGAGTQSIVKELESLKADLYKKARQSGVEKEFDGVFQRVLAIARRVDASGQAVEFNTIRNLVHDGLQLITEGHGEEFMNPDGVYAGFIEFRNLVGSKGFAVVDVPYGNEMIVTSYDGSEKIGQDFFSHTPSGTRYGRERKTCRMKDVSNYYPDIPVHSRVASVIKNAKLILAGLSSWGTSLGILFKNPAIVKAMEENRDATKVLLANPVRDDETRGMSWIEAADHFIRYMAGVAVEHLFNRVLTNGNQKLDVLIDTARPDMGTLRDAHDGKMGGYTGANTPTAADIKELEERGLEVSAKGEWTEVRMTPRRSNPDLFNASIMAVPELLAESLWKLMKLSTRENLTPIKIFSLIERHEEMEARLRDAGLSWETLGLEGAHELVFHPDLIEDFSTWLFDGKPPVWVVNKLPGESWLQHTIRQSVSNMTGNQVEPEAVGVGRPISFRDKDAREIKVVFLSREDSRKTFYQDRVSIAGSKIKRREEAMYRLGKIDFSSYLTDGSVTILLPHEVLDSGRTWQDRQKRIEAVLRFQFEKMRWILEKEKNQFSLDQRDPTVFIASLRKAGYPVADGMTPEELGKAFSGTTTQAAANRFTSGALAKNFTTELNLRKQRSYETHIDFLQHLEAMAERDKKSDGADAEAKGYHTFLKLIGEVSMAVPYARFLRRTLAIKKVPVIMTDMDGTMSAAGTELTTPMAHDHHDFSRGNTEAVHYITGQDVRGPQKQIINPLRQIERILRWLAVRTGVQRLHDGIEHVFRNMSFGVCAGSALFIYHDDVSGYVKVSQNSMSKKQVDLIMLAARLSMPKVPYPVDGYQVELREPIMVRRSDGTWKTLGFASIAVLPSGRFDTKRNWDLPPAARLRKKQAAVMEALLADPAKMIRTARQLIKKDPSLEWSYAVRDKQGNEKRVIVPDDQKQEILDFFHKNKEKWEDPEDIAPVSISAQPGGSTTTDVAHQSKAQGVHFALTNQHFHSMPALSGHDISVAVMGDEMSVVTAQDPDRPDETIQSPGNDYAVAKDPVEEIDFLGHTGPWGPSERPKTLPNTFTAYDMRGIEPYITVSLVTYSSRAVAQDGKARRALEEKSRILATLAAQHMRLEDFGVGNFEDINESQAAELLIYADRFASRSEMRERSEGEVALENARRQITEVARLIHLDPKLLEWLLDFHKILEVDIPVTMDNGTTKIFKGYRVYHNDARGAGKGGIRYSSHVNLQDVEALSMWMSIKNAITGLPYGGGKGGITVDPRELSENELARLTRGYVKALLEKDPHAIGALDDIPAPDIGTSGKEMKWLADEFLKVKHPGLFKNTRRFRMKVKTARETDTPYLDTYLSDPKRGNFHMVGSPVAVVTSKPEDKGGSLGRIAATGRGVFFITREALKVFGKELGIGTEMKGKRAAVEGGGNVGGYAARFYDEAGMGVFRIKEAYDRKESMAIASAGIKPLDLKEIDRFVENYYAKPENKGKFKGHALRAYAEAYPEKAKLIAVEEFWASEVDVLALAAGENTVTEEVAKLIKAKLVIEGANGPVKNKAAEEILTKKGVIIVPDVVANAGGVIVSYLEWRQNLVHEQWPEIAVNRMMEDKIVQAFSDVLQIAKAKNISLRQAAYVLAMIRIVNAELARNSKKWAETLKGEKPYELGKMPLELYPETMHELRAVESVEAKKNLMASVDQSLERQIAKVVEGIFEKKPKVVLIGGLTAAGKHGVTEKIYEMLSQAGIPWQQMDIDFAKPEDIRDVLDGKTVRLRDDRGEKQTLKLLENEILIVTGREALSDEVLSLLKPEENHYGIFVYTSPSLLLHGNHILTGYDIRLMREILAALVVGPENTVAEVIRRWQRTRFTETKLGFETLKNADRSINTYLPYELPFLNRLLGPVIEIAHAQRVRKHQRGFVLDVLDRFKSILEGIPVWDQTLLSSESLPWHFLARYVQASGEKEGLQPSSRRSESRSLTDEERTQWGFEGFPDEIRVALEGDRAEEIILTTSGPVLLEPNRGGVRVGVKYLLKVEGPEGTVRLLKVDGTSADIRLVFLKSKTASKEEPFKTADIEFGNFQAGNNDEKIVHAVHSRLGQFVAGLWDKTPEEATRSFNDLGAVAQGRLEAVASSAFKRSESRAQPPLQTMEVSNPAEHFVTLTRSLEKLMESLNGMDRTVYYYKKPKPGKVPNGEELFLVESTTWSKWKNHDINSVLSLLLNYAELLEFAKAGDRPQYLKIVRESAQTYQSYLQRFLEWADWLSGREKCPVSLDWMPKEGHGTEKSPMGSAERAAWFYKKLFLDHPQAQQNKEFFLSVMERVQSMLPDFEAAIAGIEDWGTSAGSLRGPSQKVRSETRIKVFSEELAGISQDNSITGPVAIPLKGIEVVPDSELDLGRRVAFMPKQFQGPQPEEFFEKSLQEILDLGFRVRRVVAMSGRYAVEQGLVDRHYSKMASIANGSLKLGGQDLEKIKDIFGTVPEILTADRILEQFGLSAAQLEILWESLPAAAKGPADPQRRNKIGDGIYAGKLRLKDPVDGIEKEVVVLNGHYPRMRERFMNMNVIVLELAALKNSPSTIEAFRAKLGPLNPGEGASSTLRRRLFDSDIPHTGTIDLGNNGWHGSESAEEGRRELDEVWFSGLPTSARSEMRSDEFSGSKAQRRNDAWFRDPRELYMAMSLPLYALRRGKEDPGIGKYPDLEFFFNDVLLPAKILVPLLLPHYATLNDSPYAPVSRFALNELNIDWSLVPELQSSLDLLRMTVAFAGEHQRVDYRSIRARERAVALMAFKIFRQKEIARNTRRAKAFAEFKNRFGREWAEGAKTGLNDYAEFMALHEMIHGKKSFEWTAAEIETAQADPQFLDLFELHQFNQWIADLQFGRAVASIAQKGGKPLFDIPMFCNKDSVEVWKHPEYFKDVRNSRRFPGVVSGSINEQWEDLALWDWTKLAGENYRFQMAPYDYWLSYADGSFAGGRVDGLHFAYRFGEGQLESGDEPGRPFIAALASVFRKYKAMAIAEAFYGKSPEAREFGFVTMKEDGANWRPITSHDDGRKPSEAFGFTEALSWHLRDNTRDPNSARFIAMTLGDLWGDPEPVKRMVFLPGQQHATALFDYRIPLPEDPDYARRAPVDLTPFLKMQLDQKTFGAQDDLRLRLWDHAPEITATLLAAARSFVRKVNGRTEIWAASFGNWKRGNLEHWFLEQWGRDTFISMPGLLFTTGRFEEAREIFRNFARLQKDGLIPNRIPQGGTPEYNNADGSLWFIQALKQYYAYTKDQDFLKEMLPVIQNIVDAYQRGTGYDYWKGHREIRMDPVDGLILSPEQATWMDADPNGKGAVTPRNGKAVEINALWYAVLRFTAQAEKALGQEQRSRDHDALAGKVKNSFNEKFWNKAFEQDAGATPLFDVIEGDPHSGALRPNMLFAISAGEDLLPLERQKAVLGSVSKDLLTSTGLGTLSPRDSHYHGWYRTEDDSSVKDQAYHQGTIWPWLIGPYVDSLVRVRTQEGESPAAIQKEIRNVLKGLVEHLMLESRIGSIPELFEGDFPKNPAGPLSQAWSVAELMRVASQYGILRFSTSAHDGVWQSGVEVAARSETRGAVTAGWKVASKSEAGIAGVFGIADTMSRDVMRSEMREEEQKTWAQENTPRLARQHVYSRQFEAGYPMHILKKIDEEIGAYNAGLISQTTLTGGLGALLPDLFEAWAAIGMNVTGIHPLWNFIKNKPIKGLDAEGKRTFFAKAVKQAMELTPIELKVETVRNGAPTTVFFRVYKTFYTEHKAPQYYLDGFIKTADGKEEPFFDEVYNDTGMREVHMAAFQEASERLIQTLENNPDPANVIILDHEVFVSLPKVFLKKALRATANHTVFRPGLFEAWEGHFGLFKFPEWLRPFIVHDGKISIADFTAEIYDLIFGVNLVEHWPALLKNIFRWAWHRVKGFYDRAKQIRSTNGIYLPRWQSPERRAVIEHFKRILGTPKPGNKLPIASNDREFFEELDKHKDLREQFKVQNEWVVAADTSRLLIWLQSERGFEGERDWLRNTFKGYSQEQGLNAAGLVAHLKEMQALLQQAASENKPAVWAELESRFAKARDLLLADPIAANVRRQVPYKGPDKYEEILAEKVLGQISAAATEAAREAGISADRSGRFNRSFDSLFQFWKNYRDGTYVDKNRFQSEFESIRARLKDQPAVKEVRETICRTLIGGRTFDEEEAHERFLYIWFLSELLGLEDRIATVEDYTYYEAQIIFRGVQAGIMLSDQDLEASATSMMKVMANGGEVVGPLAGSNTEIAVIYNSKTKEPVDALNEKGEPAYDYKTLRDRLRSGEWESRNYIFVDYDEGEKSSQEGGGWRPSARSLMEGLKTVKALRSNPEIRRERMYQSVSHAWMVDMVVGQAMGHAFLLENMLKETEERETMFSQLKYETSDYAVPLNAPDFEWQGLSGKRKHSAPGFGLFGMFQSFRELKTWQQSTIKRPYGDPATRGVEAQNSLKYHAYYGDIFRYFKTHVLGHLSSGLDPFKRQIEALAELAEKADEKERIILNLQAMDLMEMLLVRMAGDWFERYMKASPEEARVLAKQLTEGVNEEHQPWAAYIARYLDSHPNARPLATRNHSILSYLFKFGEGEAFLVNLNVNAPVKHEKTKGFDGKKARTQVLIDAEAFSALTKGYSEAKEIRVLDPKLGRIYRIHPAKELMSEIGIGVPMPLGVEVLKWTPMRALEIANILERINNGDPTAVASLKQLIQQAGAGYEPGEGEVLVDHFFEQLEELSFYDRENAELLFKENVRPLMATIGLFRPDLLKSAHIPSWWSPRFYADLLKALETLKGLFGEDVSGPREHHYYVFNTSHQGALVLAKKNHKTGDIFFASMILSADKSEAGDDGKVNVKIQEGLDRLIDKDSRYKVINVVTGENYGERGDLLQGWVQRIPFANKGPRVQFLLLQKSVTNARSEIRHEEQQNAAYQEWLKTVPRQKVAVVGTGFVGTTKAVMLVTDWGHDVTAVDVVEAKVKQLNEAKLPFSALVLPELLVEGVESKRLRFTTSYQEALEGREIVFMAVQTPQSETGHSDIFYVEDAVRQIARATKPGERKIVVGKSTVPPVTTLAGMKKSVEQVRAERIQDALVQKIGEILSHEKLEPTQVEALSEIQKRFLEKRTEIEKIERQYWEAIQRIREDPEGLKVAEAAARKVPRFLPSEMEVFLSPVKNAVGEILSLKWKLDTVLDQQLPIEFAWEPEFLREGKEVEDDRGLANRVVVGAGSPEIAEKIAALYQNPNPREDHKRRQVPIVRTDIASAQLVKYAANGYRALKISFINYIGWLAEELGFDIEDVSTELRKDARLLGSDPANPLVRHGFLAAGLGFGGSCFPKDLAALVQIARENGVLPGLVLDALAVNDVQWWWFLERGIIERLGDLNDKKIVVLGAAFKADTSDTREARSVLIIKELLKKGARVTVVDPDAKAIETLRNFDLRGASKVTYVSDMSMLQNSLFDDAAGIVLVTEWNDFKKIDFKRLAASQNDAHKPLPAVFDGRNFFDGDELIKLEFSYYRIGKRYDRDRQEDFGGFIKDVTELFLALRISYINMIAELAEKTGANIRDVVQGFGLDPIVGLDYLSPGIGWGGHNLGKALERIAKRVMTHISERIRWVNGNLKCLFEKFRFSPSQGHNEMRLPFVEEVNEINRHQIDLYVNKIKEAAGTTDLHDIKVAVLGIGYKPASSSIEKSRGLELVKELLKQGAIVYATDEDGQAVTNAKWIFEELKAGKEPANSPFNGETSTWRNVPLDNLHLMESPQKAVPGTVVQVLTTASKYFKEITGIFQGAAQLRVVDGRHFFGEPEIQEVLKLGGEYYTVGMPTRKTGAEKNSARSESRTMVEPLTPGAELWTTDQFLKKNPKWGGGTAYGLRAVTEKITDGIIPLLAQAFGVAESIAKSIMPDVFAASSAQDMYKPRNAIERARFAAAIQALGIKTVQAGDAFIFSHGLLEKGFLAVVRVVFGNAPMAVLVRTDEEVVKIKDFNRELKAQNEPAILIVRENDIQHARSELRKQVQNGPMNLKALVSGEETLEQLPDNMIIRVTQQMFRNFLNLAGERISQLVGEMQAKFAVLRSA